MLVTLSDDNMELRGRRLQHRHNDTVRSSAGNAHLRDAKDRRAPNPQTIQLRA